MSSSALSPDARHASALARAVIQHHSKSFALAARLLPPRVRDDARVLYAFCRRADDAVDEAPAGEHTARLDALRAELDAVYAGAPPADPLLLALQGVVRRHQLPRLYLDELLAGMAMDANGYRYARLEQLLLYAYRVAGTVGLMMAHVMGARGSEALRRATQLGIAMQLTNIARDVAEDYGRGRLYLPEDLLARHGLGREQLAPGGALPGGALPPELAPTLAGASDELLTLADGYYAGGDQGLKLLPSRSAFAVRAARLIYAEIGAVLRSRGCDPLSGRAVVGALRKLQLVLRAAAETLTERLRDALRARGRSPLSPTRGHT